MLSNSAGTSGFLESANFLARKTRCELAVLTTLLHDAKPFPQSLVLAVVFA